MSNRKKFVITVLVIIVLLGIGLLLGASSRRRVSQRPPSAPSIPQEFEGELPIQPKFDKKDFNFPSSLPLISISPEEISKEEALELSSSLGFQGEPTEINDFREGKKYLWFNDTFYLIIGSQSPKIEYGLQSLITEVPDNKLSDDDLVKIAQDFFTSNEIFGKDEIKFTSLSFLTENPESEGFVRTSRDDAEVFQVNFTYRLTDYEILTLDPSDPAIFAQIQTDGTVFFAQATKLSQVSQTKDKYPLKNFEDVVGSLNEAVLVSIVGGYINLPDLSNEDVKSLTLEKIELAYLQDTSVTKTLQPVYLLSGEAEISNLQETVTALFYLPALKQP